MSDKETPDVDPRKLSPLGHIIYVTGEINQELANDVTTQLLAANVSNQTNGEYIPITLLINSPGGEVSAGWQICDMMDFIETPVYTTGTGLIASAALMIFMNGEPGHRTLSDRASIMTHQYSAGNQGNHAELIAQNIEFVNLHNRIIKHYVECTGLSIKQVEDNLLKPYNVWLTPTEARTFKLCDKVIVSKKTKKIQAIIKTAKNKKVK